MKKIILILILALLLSIIFISCNKNSNISIEKIRVKLEAGETFEQKDPGSNREFEPYLNDKWIGQAISYGPYRLGQAPGEKGPTETEILEDLDIIKEYWNLIRVYNSDDDTEKILKVIRDNELPIKVLLGVWLAKETDDKRMRLSNIKNTIKCIELVNEFPKIICGVNVGNETQVYWSWHKMKTENLIRYIGAVRNNVLVPVTTADDYNFWNKHESQVVADEIDFIVVHIHPLWNGKTLSNTFSWLDRNYENIKKIHPDKQIVIGEIGWATKYNPDKTGDGEQGSLIKGDVSVEAQEKFLIELDEWIKENKVTTFIFEVFDEPWKGGGENSGPTDVEKNWGVFYENRTPKESFQKYLTYKQHL